MVRNFGGHSFMTNCGWDKPSTYPEVAPAKPKKLAAKVRRKITNEGRAQKLKDLFKEVGEKVYIASCRQIVKELGAKRTDQLLKRRGDSALEDARYEELKDLAWRYR